MQRRTTAAWQELLRAAEIPHAPVWSHAELFNQPELAGRLRAVVRDPAGRPVDLVASPLHISGADLPAPAMPPALGQDTDDVLRQLLGLDAARLQQLREQGAIGSS
jgi:crotonobetainyl-CoA:carnitine CoA-transferase CaiB-like acyl-CoA transferase